MRAIFPNFTTPALSTVAFSSAFGLLTSLGPLSFADEVGSGPPERDREAILKMAGDFEVLFNFEETVSLRDDYKIKDPYQEGANEMVTLVEDSGSRIVLQHILLAGESFVVKHWKQIWTWQDTEITEFRGNETWTTRTVAADEVEGTWSQLVTQTDDSPRYESYGVWKHDLGYSRWESQITARPLPRREYTKRDDYDVLLTVNRHSLTPHGWVHEQDSVKQVVNDALEPMSYIAREIGTNYYDTADAEIDFSSAEDYWEATGSFWGDVSAFWEDIEDEAGTFTIAREVDGESVGKKINAMANEVKDGGEPPTKDAIHELIAKSVSKK